MALELQNLTKLYKDKVAVDCVNMSITPGIWGLLGANGAGKTTMMRMTVGILRPSEGRVQYDGIDINTLGSRYRELLGYLPQSFGFYPEFSVRGYLEYMGSLKGLSKYASRRKIEELLFKLQLDNIQSKKIRKLSGGTKRRVGMAQALLNDPDILVLDEPSSGLDPGERIRLRQILSEFAQRKIVLISTHIVSDIENMANRIAIMKNGRISAIGTTNDLIKKVNGKVWEADCLRDRLTDYKGIIRIVNMRSDGDVMTKVRYVADEDVLPDSHPMIPTLEDLYFWLIKEEASGKERNV